MNLVTPALSCLLALASSVHATAQSGKVFTRYSKPLRPATLDLETGTVTRGALVGNRGPTTTVDFDNNDLGGFVGLDSGNGFCEWFDAGVKGFANQSDLMNSVVFAYCSAKLGVLSGGPGGSVRLGFYEDYVLGGPVAAALPVATLTLTGLPANTSSSSFFGGFRCYFLRVRFANLVNFADGPIGYSWGFLDSGTSVLNPMGGVLAGTWPFLSCVSDCSASIGFVDAQGMTDMIDEYCPVGTLRSTFTFGTTSGSFTSMSMAIEEVTDLPPMVVFENSAACPNPDILTSTDCVIGTNWNATMTLGLGRLAPSQWLLYFGSAKINPPNGVLIPQLTGGLNFGSSSNGRKLLCSLSTMGASISVPHTGVLGSISSTPNILIPNILELVGHEWCGQALVLGPCSSANGGGNARLSSMVSGTVGTP